MTYLTSLILAVFLILNIYSSQQISPLFFRLTENTSKESTAEFLGKIKTLPEFKKELTEAELVFGKEIENQVFESDSIRKAKINKLEQVLLNSPKARDVLYSLYLLYKEKDDEKMADHYFKRVKAVDPDVKEN